jgi:hypothetical protein
MVEDSPGGLSEFINQASTQTNNSNSVSITGTAFTPYESIPVVKSTGSAGCCQRVAVRDYHPGTNVWGRFLDRGMAAYSSM